MKSLTQRLRQLVLTYGTNGYLFFPPMPAITSWGYYKLDCAQVQPGKPVCWGWAFGSNGETHWTTKPEFLPGSAEGALDRLEAYYREVYPGQAALGERYDWILTEKTSLTELPEGYETIGMGYSGTHNFTEYRKGRSKYPLIYVEGLGYYKAREMSQREVQQRRATTPRLIAARERCNIPALQVP